MWLNSLLQVVDSVATNPSIDSAVNAWKYVAIVEFILIILLVFLAKRGDKKGMNPDLLNAKSVDIDTDSMMSDIFKSKELYDKLIKKCHPDRFVDETMKSVMTEFSQEITKNKSNYGKLVSIKEEIENQFNIKI